MRVDRYLGLLALESDFLLGKVLQDNGMGLA
jgi:hypothetical protein